MASLIYYLHNDQADVDYVRKSKQRSADEYTSETKRGVRITLAEVMIGKWKALEFHNISLYVKSDCGLLVSKERSGLFHAVTTAATKLLEG